MSAIAMARSSRKQTLAWYAVNIFWYLGFVALGLTLLLLTVSLMTDFTVKYAHLPVQVEYAEAPNGTSRAPISAPGSLAVSGFRFLRVEAADLPGLDYMLLMPALLMLGYLFIAYHLRGLMRDVRQGRPFADENPGRIRRIGITLVAAGPVFGFFMFLYGKIYMNRLDIPGASIEVPFDIHPFVVLLGAIVLVIGEAFGAGVKLRHEQDLTV